MKARATALVVTVLLALGVFAPVASGHPAHCLLGNPEKTTGCGDETTTAGIPPDGPHLSEEAAALTMPDDFGEASVTAATTGHTCQRMARDDRTNGPIPADDYAWHVVYFVPSDRPVYFWDRPTACSDGSKRESNVGYSVHNNKRWMGTRTNEQGARINGKSFRVMLRTDSYAGRSFNFYRVMFVQGQQNDAYYTVDPFVRMRDELEARGWNRLHVKYVTYADILTTNDVAGAAEFNGNHTATFRRYLTQQGNGPYGARWGCADEGDTTPMQEALHGWGNVNRRSSEHDANNPYHTHLNMDVMYWERRTSYSAQWHDGGVVAQSRWDDGEDTYTNRVLSFPEYLTGVPGQGLRICDPA